MISIELTSNGLAGIVIAVAMSAIFVIVLAVAGSNYGD